MKYISLPDICPNSVSMQIVHVYEYTTPYYLKEYVINKRHHSCIAFLEEGDFVYTIHNHVERYHSGSLLYIPCGASYQYRVTSDSIHSYQIDFDFYNLEDHDKITTGDEPILVSSNLQGEIRLIIQSICVQALFTTPSAELEAMGNLYRLISFIFQNNEDKAGTARTKMNMVINYMNHNYMDNIQTSQLSDMCSLSNAQFYRLFATATGMTPHNYLLQLRVNAACSMLRSTNLSVTEIAAYLGFDNIFSFSQTFKRIKNISPSQYRNNVMMSRLGNPDDE